MEAHQAALLNLRFFWGLWYKESNSHSVSVWGVYSCADKLYTAYHCVFRHRRAWELHTQTSSIMCCDMNKWYAQSLFCINSVGAITRIYRVWMVLFLFSLVWFGLGHDQKKQNKTKHKIKSVNWFTARTERWENKGKNKIKCFSEVFSHSVPPEQLHCSSVLILLSLWTPPPTSCIWCCLVLVVKSIV